MKAKVLVSHYVGEAGFTIHRVYQEKHFGQAELDLELLEVANSPQKWELIDSDVFEPSFVKYTPKEKVGVNGASGFGL
jgi:hypothetical protein